jgi:D-xylose transport system ATP-binding protein
VNSDTPLLEIDGVTKRFGAVAALNDVSFVLRSGEVTAVLGDNGAGKSTLVKWLGGVYSADCGRLLMRGAEISLKSPQQAQRLGIGVAYQDLALFDNLSVAANLFAGHELVWPSRPRGLGLVRRREMSRRAQGILKRLEVRIPNQKTPMGLLSGGQRQAVAVAKAVAFAQQVVILDEPTAALGIRETRNVLELIRRLAHQGAAVMLITHNLEQAVMVANKAVVLRQGVKVGELAPTPENHERMVAMIVGPR